MWRNGMPGERILGAAARAPRVSGTQFLRPAADNGRETEGQIDPGLQCPFAFQPPRLELPRPPDR